MVRIATFVNIGRLLNSLKSEQMKNKILKIFLPFFPENKELKKHWWHKFLKVLTIIVTVSSLYSILWLIALFYFVPRSWMDSPIYQQVYHIFYFPAYLPLNFANFFSSTLIYKTLFQLFLHIPIIGPLALIFILISIFYFAPSLLYRLAIYISQKFYMKKVKIIFSLVILGVALFSIYVWKYQQIVTEGSLIVDDHCIKVNPLIIDRKNKYTDQYNLMMNSASVEDFTVAFNNYRKSAVAYIGEEKLWLARQRKFLDSKEFNLLMPAYMKEALSYQYQMYEGQYYTFFYLEQAWDEPDKKSQVELSNKGLEEVKKSNDSQDKYNAVWEREKGKQNWMFNFVKVPISECPPENNDIPVILNPFAPPPVELNPYGANS